MESASQNWQMMAKTQSKADHNRVVVLLAILAVVAVVWIVMVLRGGDLSGAAAVRGKVDYQPHDLPRLDMARLEGDQADQVGGHRNPFTFGAPPTPTPRPPTPTRQEVARTPLPTPTPRMARGVNGEMKPPPPPFDREYLGHFGPLRLQVAAFRRPGADSNISEIEVATAGAVLDDIFIIREIGLESVVIGFVGYDRSEDTRVPVAEK